MMILDKRVFNALVNKAVIDHFRNLFGPTTVKIINFYLKRYDTSLEKICEEPEKVSKALHISFEEGANILEREIVKAAYQAFKLKPKKVENLETALERLKDSAKDL
ncbi:MAG: hypothetical protein ACRD5H_10100 [Nitrososphaerales archaeon]